MALTEKCGYCEKEENKWNSILYYKCEECDKYVHYDCIKSKQPSPLLGDAFFTFKCQSCGEDNKEEFDRVKVSWRNAIMLALYNLHKTGQGKCGFFHWKAHISSFIHTNWLVLFGQDRKQTSLWMGTIAGTLSAGCPDVFESGANLLEQGYWRLVDVEPPLMNAQKKVNYNHRKRNIDSPIEFIPDRSRRRTKANALNAAIELKEKREALMEKQKKKAKKNKGGSLTVKEDDVKPVKQNEMIPQELDDSVSSSCSILQEGEFSIEETESCLLVDQYSQDSLEVSNFQSSVNERAVTQDQPSCLTYESLGLTLAGDDDSDCDLDIDIESIAVNSEQFVDIRSASPEIGTLIPLEDIKFEPALPAPDIELDLVSNAESEGLSERDIQEEMAESESGDKNDNADNDANEEEEEEEEEGDTDSDDDGFEEPIDNESTSGVDTGRVNTEHGEGSGQVRKKKVGRPRKRRRLDDPLPASSPERLQRISVFEESELLNRLNLSTENNTLTPELAVLRRKLICNQTNREYGQPVFDLDEQVEKSIKSHRSEDSEKDIHQRFGPLFPRLMTKSSNSKETRDLDRFMMKDSGKRKEREYTSFRQRLVGLKDNELRPTVSPYTTRILVPFIWRNRNMERKPLRMRLLQEIQAYPHRNDPSWMAPPCPSIDYCYVRPEHIPSVNALAREFFWPGIDMSECLQYPDFSCVVLYRKIVIAFAFMVPDRGYNEAYISFIFTHPEWRGVGIASFMLYHLIQTCMGKDVVLHVSVSNPAMLMYQKFGFKAEELSLNFYYKYFPSDCTDSSHAFLMRLTR